MMRGAEELLREFVERVLKHGELGTVAELCTHRAQLYLPGNRRLYSTPLIEEGLSAFLRSLPYNEIKLEIEELWSADYGLVYPYDEELEGAAALLRFSSSEWQEQGLVTIRAARGRILRLRIETGMSVADDVAGLSTLPVSSVEVSSLPGEAALPPALQSAAVSEQLREYMDELAGRTFDSGGKAGTGGHAGTGDSESTGGSSGSEGSARMDGFVGFEGSAGDALLFRTPGGLFFDEIVGTQRKGGGYVLALAWYKGILQPRSEIDFPDYAPLASTTVGGLSLTEFHGEDRVRDLRFFDDTEYTRLREFALSLKRIDPESGSDSHTDVD